MHNFSREPTENGKKEARREVRQKETARKSAGRYGTETGKEEERQRDAREVARNDREGARAQIEIKTGGERREREGRERGREEGRDKKMVCASMRSDQTSDGRLDVPKGLLTVRKQ